MKKSLKFITLLLVVITFSNCSTKKFINFQSQENEIYPSDNLKNFLNKNKNPKVVLRVPNTSYLVTETEKKNKDDYNYLYDAIEKELLKQGFTVRDRQLFNQVVSNKDNNVDYSILKDKTDTDLIIELSKLDTDVLYETNKYKTDKGKDGVLNYIYKRYGAEVEFKIIIIQNNEFAGTYTFFYSPCNEKYPCEINSDFDKKWKRISKGKEGFEEIEKNSLLEFIRYATINLVDSMRK